MAAILAKIGSFLAKPLALVGQWLLTLLVQKLSAWVKAQIAKAKRKKEIQEDLKRYKETKTPEEQERAFQDLLKHLNR